tara:strand:+ start:25209 stop:25364 length:156 start_codon:yes stop_codon:yes gene_type:complete
MKGKEPRPYAPLPIYAPPPVPPEDDWSKPKDWPDNRPPEEKEEKRVIIIDL